jgi:hypothetical protein
VIPSVRSAGDGKDRIAGDRQARIASDRQVASPDAGKLDQNVSDNLKTRLIAVLTAVVTREGRNSYARCH